MSRTIFHEAGKRGHANHGWLDTYHSFSFANWYDPEKVHFGRLRVINDDTIAGGMGFGTHPHDNMEIITVVLEGGLEHKDSMGHTETIHPDEVQVMSAGTGLFHSEYNHFRDKETKLFQIWIFPEQKNVKPRYEQRYFLKDDRINQLQTLVSPINNDDPGLKIHQQAWIYRTELNKQKSIQLTLRNSNNGFYILLVEGKLSVEGQLLNRRDAFGFSEIEQIEIIAEEDSDVLILEVPMV